MITRNTFQLRKKRKEKENRHRATEPPFQKLNREDREEFI